MQGRLDFLTQHWLEVTFDCRTPDCGNIQVTLEPTEIGNAARAVGLLPTQSPDPLTVYVARIADRHGSRLTIHRTHKAAAAWIASYCRAQWRTELGDTDMPDGDDEIMAAYGAAANAEYFIREATLDSATLSAAPVHSGALAIATGRELFTVIAALRHYQGRGQQTGTFPPAEVRGIATLGSTIEPLTVPEIDDLCYRLNQGYEAGTARESLRAVSTGDLLTEIERRGLYVVQSVTVDEVAATFPTLSREAIVERMPRLRSAVAASTLPESFNDVVHVVFTRNAASEVEDLK
jgi:hypothetical protein